MLSSCVPPNDSTFDTGPAPQGGVSGGAGPVSAEGDRHDAQSAEQQPARRGARRQAQAAGYRPGLQHTVSRTPGTPAWPPAHCESLLVGGALVSHESVSVCQA